MRLPDKLFQVGKLSDSLGVYVPVMGVQRVIALGRSLLFMYMVSSTAEFGLWALGAMLFDLIGQFVTFGAGHGLTRYVSYYEARRRLQDFYRRMRWIVGGVCVALTLVALLGVDTITRWVIQYDPSAPANTFDPDRLVCLAAILNALLMGLHMNLLGFMYGLRVYRLVSGVELLACVLFTLIGAVALVVWPTGLAILCAHAAAMAVATLAGYIGTRAAVSRLASGHPQAAALDEPVVGPPVNEDEPPEVELPAHDVTVAADDTTWQMALRIYRFGMLILISGLIGRAVHYISFMLTHKAYGKEVAGIFFGLVLFTRPVEFIGAAVFTVVFSFVARRWEDRREDVAVYVLESSYKAIAMALMTLSVLLYATAEWWLHILPTDYYRYGLPLVGAQLLFFQTMAHLSLMHIVARLRERPLMIAAVAVVGGIVNLLLGWWWMQSAASAAQGALLAARAMGVGMFVGGGIVAMVYLLRSPVKLQTSTYAVFLCPILLILPAYLTAVIWGLVLFVAAFSHLLLSPNQKRLIDTYLLEMFRSIRRRKRS